MFTSCDADAAAATVFYTTEHDECVNNQFFVLSASENFSVQVNHLLEYGKMYSRLRNSPNLFSELFHFQSNGIYFIETLKQ